MPGTRQLLRFAAGSKKCLAHGKRLSGFPCKGLFRYANLNLPSNMIANCAFAMAHSRGRILHSFSPGQHEKKKLQRAFVGGEMAAGSAQFGIQ
jgi:hypothetical protein